MVNARLIASDGNVAPPADSMDNAMREDASSELDASNDRRLVVLLSDDPLLSRALSRLLRKAGYEVVVSEGSYLGPERDGQRRPSLIIVDVPDERPQRAALAGSQLPGRPDAPSVLWIGEPSQMERRRDGHLAKPFTGNQLLSKVASLLPG